MDKYLGIGVYAEFKDDGFFLRTGSHESTECENEIWLGHEEITNLLNGISEYAKRINGLEENNNE